MARTYAPGEVRGLSVERAFAAQISRLARRRDGGSGVAEIRLSEVEDTVYRAEEIDHRGTTRWSTWPDGQVVESPYAPASDNDQADTSGTSGVDG